MGCNDRASQSVDPYGGTLSWSAQPLSRGIGLTSFPVRGMGLSGSGMPGLRRNNSILLVLDDINDLIPVN